MPQRKSNMELLRIFGIYLIILYHCAFHSGFPSPTPLSTNLSYNMRTVRIFWFFGELGVNLFILTTGYFQAKGRFKWGKLLSLLAQTLFYSVLTHSIGLFAGAVSFKDYTRVLILLFPVICGQFWFATAYIIVYLFSPYMNRLIANMDGKIFRYFLVTALVLYSVIPTAFGFINGNPEGWLYYNRMIWLFIMYFTGAYIRLHSLPLLKSMKSALACAMCAFALMVSSIRIIHALDIAFWKSWEVAYFWPPNTIPMVFLSVGTFCVFLQLKIPDTPWINRVASATFGIYLLHDSHALRPWIWKTLLRFPEKLDSPTLIPQILAACACIFLIGMTIDFARQALERVTLKQWLASAAFQRLETRFDVNADATATRLDAARLDVARPDADATERGADAMEKET